MVTIVENYGADIDGNRGELRTCYEVEESDYDDIREQLLEREEQGEFLNPYEYVTLIDPYTEGDVEVEIYVPDYLGARK